MEEEESDGEREEIYVLIEEEEVREDNEDI